MAPSPKRPPLQPKCLYDLPSDVIDDILSRLPIRDAVGTSILSHSWRGRWRSIPDLHVDAGDSVAFVDRVLLLHCGPIRSFSLTINFPPFDLLNDSHVERWLSALSRDPRPLRSLVLSFERCYSPSLNSTLFSLRNLTHLELHDCKLPDHLVNFHGFPSLQTLIFDSCSVPFASELISSCPLLQNLTLIDVDEGEIGELYLHIHVPSLRSLFFRGALVEFELVTAPLLTTVTVDLEDLVIQAPSSSDDDDDEDDDGILEELCKADLYFEGDCHLTEAFGRVECVEKLELLSFSLRFLGECGMPERIIDSFDRLKVLAMTVEFEYVNRSLKTALWLLRSSPNLEDLEIIGSSYKNVQWEIKQLGSLFWQKQNQWELSKLRTAKFTHIMLATRELEFIYYILTNAQGLEKMVIDVSPEDDRSVVKSGSKYVMKFLRDSTQAEITFIGL